jgi:hypothetical protein
MSHVEPSSEGNGGEIKKILGIETEIYNKHELN